jgi:outer membrane protein assembly factor BamB
VWSHELKDGVLCRPTADGSRIYVGARDHHFYCLERRTGKVVWERDLGSPIVTAAVLSRVPELGVTTAVYVVASDGQVYCLGPNTGRVYWSVDLSDEGKSPLTLWSSPALVTRRDSKGETRQLVFGAAVGPDGAQSPAVFSFEDRVEPDAANEPVESRP